MDSQIKLNTQQILRKEILTLSYPSCPIFFLPCPSPACHSGVMAIPVADDLTQTCCEHYVPSSWNAVPTLNIWETSTPPSRLNLCITFSGRPSLKTRVQDVNWTAVSLTGRFWYFLSSVMNEPAALFNFQTRTSDFSLCSLSHYGNGYLKILSSLNHSPFSLCNGNRFTRTDHCWSPWRHPMWRRGCAILPGNWTVLLEDI